MNESKTNPDFWDTRWEQITSNFIQRGEGVVSDAIYDFFGPHLEQYRGGRLLEVGGAPGRYLGALATKYDMRAVGVDYSTIGCEQLRENFKSAGMKVEVIERDVLQVPAETDEKADVVFSLGLVEHFEDPLPMLKAHLDYLKSGGTLIVGVPNYSGIYEKFWKKLSPELLSVHVLPTMKKENWNPWIEELGLEIVKFDYIGGFYPQSLNKGEFKGFCLEKVAAKVLKETLGRMPKVIGSWNHPYFASYLIGAFRVKP